MLNNSGIEVSATAFRQGKEKESKLVIGHADYMVLFIGSSEDFTKKLQELNEFAKDAIYKINVQKSVAFLYTNKLSEG